MRLDETYLKDRDCGFRRKSQEVCQWSNLRCCIIVICYKRHKQLFAAYLCSMHWKGSIYAS